MIGKIFFFIETVRFVQVLLKMNFINLLALNENKFPTLTKFCTSYKSIFANFATTAFIPTSKNDDEAEQWPETKALFYVGHKKNLIIPSKGFIR